MIESATLVKSKLFVYSALARMNPSNLFEKDLRIMRKALKDERFCNIKALFEELENLPGVNKSCTTIEKIHCCNKEDILDVEKRLWNGTFEKALATVMCYHLLPKVTFTSQKEEWKVRESDKYIQALERVENNQSKIDDEVIAAYKHADFEIAACLLVHDVYWGVLLRSEDVFLYTQIEMKFREFRNL